MSNIPKGFTTKEDLTGECYECAFCEVVGDGENSEVNCDHPTKSNLMCGTNDFILVKVVDEDKKEG